jgi:phosphoribosylanthranilate isomerase
MSLWIKICATTSLEDALLAAEAGADAVGFVFAPSPRRVTREQVAAIAPHLPARIERIGVFVDASFTQVEATVRECRLTGVQLHSKAGPDIPSQLRQRFGPKLRTLRVVHFGPTAAQRVAEIDTDSSVNGILIDSRTAAAAGGTGVAYDWSAARALFFRRSLSRQRPRIAAGGLTPANVAEAIATLQPWGVDVASGVESEPGRKDAAKVRAFVANARAANASGTVEIKVV